ncbi:MAG TPA: pyruvate formate lyase family protein [Candidatus Hydrogenedentes bacterium]|nr:pyruvate formate lyase family protein [Candidatus Hydrogenedentota bacterium]
MPIHPRNQRYKENVLAAPYEICIERARYYTQSYRTTEGEHPALRAAKAFAHTLRNMSIYVLEEERMAGNRSSKLVGTVIPIERGDINTVLELELGALLNRDRQPFHISPEDQQELKQEILPYWRGKTLRDRKKALWKEQGLWFRPALNPVSLWRRSRSLDLKKLKQATMAPGTQRSTLLRGVNELLYNNPAIVMNVFDVQGHLILGHKNILQEGFCGVKARAQERLERAIQNNDSEGQAFLESVILSCDAIQEFAARFAEEAERQAAGTSDEARRKNLLDMAARCRHVPFYPPRDFREALQAFWLTQAGAIIAYGMSGILAIGRLDQYLFNFYSEDCTKGCLSEEEAVEWLEELFIKLSYNVLLLPHVGKQTGSELGSDSCAPTVGGLGPNGEDATNDLSFLALEAFANVKSLGNSFSIRFSRKSSDEFWRKSLQTYRQTSGAALFCDEQVVAALKNCGMPEQDARDYGIIGCVEPTGDGNTFGCTSGNDISLAAAVEMTLLNGYLRIMGRRIGPRTGNPCHFQDFNEFLTAYKRQVEFMVHTVAKAVNLKDQAYREGFPCPFISATLSGCVEHARDMTAGGSQYNYGSISARGFGTAVNCLAAIKHFVYDQRTITMQQLLRALEVNFKGEETLRLRLANGGPKYGCGDDAVDNIAREVCGFFCREVAAQQTLRGGPFRPGFFSYGMHVLEGLFLGATPDGRRAGEPVSNSFSPANNSEKRGPTAAMQSVAKTDHTLISNGCALNMKMMPKLFKEEDSLNRVIALVKGFFALGGMEVQFNVVSNDTLRDAQQHPDQYRDLVVRVSGYSALFTDLGKALQDEIIQRSEFENL